MKVSCMQKELSRGLSIVSRAVATRTTLPVLSNVLLSTEGSRLKLAANNLETCIAHHVATDVQREGAITVPAKPFISFIKSLPPERIELEADTSTQTLNIRCGRARATFKGIDAQEFPIPPFSEETVGITLPTESLKQMIDHVAFAAATDESRPVLTGVLAELSADQLTFAAADSYRLSVDSMPLESSQESFSSVIIPAQALQELRRILGDEESVTVSLSPNRNQIFFRLGATDLVSQLVEGTFPDYKQIIPKEYKTRIVTGTADLLKAVRMASIFARDAANICQLQAVLNGSGGLGRLIVAAASSEFGDSTSELEANITGNPIRIAFNAQFLAEALGAIDTPEVAIELRDPTDPGVIRPVGDSSFIHVLMPMIIHDK